MVYLVYIGSLRSLFLGRLLGHDDRCGQHVVGHFSDIRIEDRTFDTEVSERVDHVDQMFDALRSLLAELFCAEEVL